MPGFVGLPELLLFGIVALLIFGPKKLPEMGRSLGKGMREFKDSVSGNDNAVVEGEERTPTAQMAAADTEPNPFEADAIDTPAEGEPVRVAR